MDEAVKARIDQLINDNKIMLFMKGSKDFPQCGFSGQVAAILNHAEVEYATFDVLSDMEIRQGIKEYSNWPTIPQLYVNKQFIGGCDIITEMYQSGELQPLVGSSVVPE